MTFTSEVTSSNFARETHYPKRLILPLVTLKGYARRLAVRFT